ncbi:MAG: hypothetical protein ACSLEY_00400 [Candidatus Saccharimonadales bacterium]
MYTLKTIVQRGSLLGATVALVAATILPSGVALADALNPLTDRSLTLSSAAPGWDSKDGSGNTTYAGPNTGANGQQTGNTFDFKVSSDSTGARDIKAMTFQYCTTPAGNCKGPGNNPYNIADDARLNNGDAGTWDAYKSDLNIVTAAPTEAAFATYVTNTDASSPTENPDGIVSSVPAATTTGGNFMVYYLNGTTWTASTGWSMTAQNNESGSETLGAGGGYTGANNQITLANTGTGFSAGTRVKVVFFGTNTNYITNPGADEFFVRINHWDDTTNRADTNVIDGGVTVANVMNQSIQIMTKVLETMDFSVGTVDPYTLDSTGGAGSQFALATGGKTAHGPCDPVVKSMNASDPLTSANGLEMGNPDGENSLETDKTYSTHSYWRLSSNSSGGATVYYSGVTLSNTVGDKIDAIGSNADVPIAGKEQFGLALDNGSDANHLVSYAKERDSGKVFQNGDDNDVAGVHSSTVTQTGSNPSYHEPGLWSMSPALNYGGGTGAVNTQYTDAADSPDVLPDAIDTAFAFDETSNQIPVPLAATTDVEGAVVDCVSGKVRYIANIASTTPAGIYTTKINYIASPKY